MEEEYNQMRKVAIELIKNSNSPHPSYFGLEWDVELIQTFWMA